MRTRTPSALADRCRAVRGRYVAAKRITRSTKHPTALGDPHVWRSVKVANQYAMYTGGVHVYHESRSVISQGLDSSLKSVKPINAETEIGVNSASCHIHEL
jgi:hypothetical protein